MGEPVKDIFHDAASVNIRCKKCNKVLGDKYTNSIAIQDHEKYCKGP